MVKNTKTWEDQWYTLIIIFINISCDCRTKQLSNNISLTIHSVWDNCNFKEQNTQKLVHKHRNIMGQINVHYRYM